MRRNLLIIEDSATQAQELRLHYEKRGFQVAIAESGAQGLALLKNLTEQDRHYPDLIVLDYLLPGENGIEVCRKLKSTAQYCAIPVLIYSVEKGLGSMLAAYEAGADYYLVKDTVNQSQKLLDLLMEAVLLRLQGVARTSLSFFASAPTTTTN